jgi:hypothetical protein
MPDLAILVINDPQKTDEVLAAWLTIGVTGATIFDTTGLARHMDRFGARDDLPLIPSLSSLLRSREEANRTLFAVLPDGFDVEALVAATEEAVGSLEDDHTGIMFLVPVRQVWGRAFSKKKSNS